jgi:hypothetical protein
LVEPPAKPKLQNLFAPVKSSIKFGQNALDELDEDDPSYLLNTLYYTDAISDDEPSPYLDAMKRKKWLYEAYSDFLSTRHSQPSGPKTYILKLIEFNKIALIEKQPSATNSAVREDWWCTSSNP